LSALSSLSGVCVNTSHSLTVPSPDPEAKFWQSGLKLMDKTAYVCPYILLDERVTGLTLKLETG